MRKLLSYLNEVIFYYISLMAMTVPWLSSGLIDTPLTIPCEQHWTRMFILLGVTVVGLLILIYTRRVFKIFGFMLGFGALLGAGGSLIGGVCEAISCASPDGFFGWAGLFIGSVIFTTIFASILGVGLKGVITSLIRLDFFNILIYGMILLTGYSGLTEWFLAMAECSTVFLIFVIICGIPSGAASTTSSSGDGFIDENGQLHFASHSIGRDR